MRQLKPTVEFGENLTHPYFHLGLWMLISIINKLKLNYSVKCKLVKCMKSHEKINKPAESMKNNIKFQNLQNLLFVCFRWCTSWRGGSVTKVKTLMTTGLEPNGDSKKWHYQNVMMPWAVDMFWHVTVSTCDMLWCQEVSIRDMLWCHEVSIRDKLWLVRGWHGSNSFLEQFVISEHHNVIQGVFIQDRNDRFHIRLWRELRVREGGRLQNLPPSEIWSSKTWKYFWCQKIFNKKPNAQLKKEWNTGWNVAPTDFFADQDLI